MKDTNIVCISGRVVADSECKNISNDKAILLFNIASNTVQFDKVKKEYSDKANFFNCQKWTTPEDKLHPLLLKGAQVVISGELVQNRYETEHGKKSKVLIIAKHIQIVKKESTSLNKEGVSSDSDTVFNDDDIPF